MDKIEHIGIAVRDLDAAIILYERLLGVPCYKTEEVQSEGVMTAFFMTGHSKVELLAALRPETPVGRFLDQKGEGIHHVAFEVADIRAEMRRLKEGGFQLLSEEPRAGADNKIVCFVHPKDTKGLLIELCQQIKD